jgi:hypothetical protein
MGFTKSLKGYPLLLTAQQTKIEMKNWDQVSLPGIMRTLNDLDDSVDYVLIGNNAGQGLPLAQSLPQNSIGNHAAITFSRNVILRPFDRLRINSAEGSRFRNCKGDRPVAPTQHDISALSRIATQSVGGRFRVAGSTWCYDLGGLDNETQGTVGRSFRRCAWCPGS